METNKNNMNMDDKSNNKNNKDSKNKFIIPILILIILALILCGFFGYRYLTRDTSEYYSKTSKITQMPEEDRQAYVNQIVDDGMMNVNYQTSATFEGIKSIDFKVTNIEQNKYPIQFELIDENGDTIYTSGEIPQGYECTEVALDREHEKGSFEWQIKLGYVNEGNVSSIFPINVEIK